MANQTTDAAIAKIITQIRTYVPAIQGVIDGPKTTAQLEDSEFPCCFVVEKGEPLITREITSSRDVTFTLELQLYYKASETTRKEIRDIGDDLIRYLEKGVITFFDDTVTNLTVMNEIRVEDWGDGMRSRAYTVDVMIEQDFPA